MIPPAQIKLPNGLELQMFPIPERRKGFAVVESGETEAELWARFAEALKSTDFEAIAKVYSVATPRRVTRPSVVQGPQPKRLTQQAPLNLTAAQEAPPKA